MTKFLTYYCVHKHSIGLERRSPYNLSQLCQASGYWTSLSLSSSLSSFSLSPSPHSLSLCLSLSITAIISNTNHYYCHCCKITSLFSHNWTNGSPAQRGFSVSSASLLNNLKITLSSEEDRTSPD